MGSSPSHNTTFTEILGYRVDLMVEIGRGAFGTVYKGVNKDGEIVAMKKLSKKDKRKTSREAVRLYFLKSCLQHENIVRIYDVKSWRHSMWIIMEHCDLGNLDSFFQKYRHILTDTESKLKLMKQIIQGIVFLHNKDIVHRDIKPGNILVKDNNGFALIKLCDFGLSKILDPNDTSSMSSDVGTLSFKAPEFWAKQTTDNEIRYHRNVDVYAAGLTFVAMLQFTHGLTLMPVVEGSMQRSESRAPIGFTAHNRMSNMQPDVTIVTDRPSDDAPTRAVKELTRGMTRVSQELRMSAAQVLVAMETVIETCRLAVETEISLSQSFTLRWPESNANVMCLTRTFLVLRGAMYSARLMYSVHDVDTGTLLTRWGTPCVHLLGPGCLQPLRTAEEQDTGLLVEACEACEAVRVTDMESQAVIHCLEEIRICTMCAGPGGTLLAWEGGGGKLLQLTYTGEERKHAHVTRRWPDHGETNGAMIEEIQVKSMCYCSYSHVVVLLSSTNSTLRGFDLDSGDTLWCHDVIPGVSHSICGIAQGLVLAAREDRLNVIQSDTGSLLGSLFDNVDVTGLSEVTFVNDDGLYRVAFKNQSGNHGNQIRNHGNNSRNHDNQSRNHGKNSGNHGNQSRHHGNQRKISCCTASIRREPNLRLKLEPPPDTYSMTSFDETPR